MLIFVGNLLEDVKAKDFYFDNLQNILEGDWNMFLTSLKSICLRPFWQNEIMSQIQKLRMKPSESFGAYYQRARELQREIGRQECSDILLAQFLEMGLPDPFLKAMRRSRAIQVQPFSFVTYVTLCKEEYEYI